MIEPSPRQLPQVVAMEKKPCWVRTWPVPRQLGQVRTLAAPPLERLP